MTSPELGLDPAEAAQRGAVLVSAVLKVENPSGKRGWFDSSCLEVSSPTGKKVPSWLLVDRDTGDPISGSGFVTYAPRFRNLDDVYTSKEYAFAFSPDADWEKVTLRCGASTFELYNPADLDRDMVFGADDRCPREPEDMQPPQPRDGCPLPRAAGLGKGSAVASILNVSELCDVKYATLLLPREARSSLPNAPDETKTCEALAAAAHGLVPVRVRLTGAERSEFTLSLKNTTVSSAGAAPVSAVAWLVPGEVPEWRVGPVDREWKVPINGSQELDIVLAFESAKPRDRLRIANRDVPIGAREKDPLVETRNKLLLSQDDLRGKGDPCVTRATLVTEGGVIQVSGDIERRNGKWVPWCPGAEHTWVGTSQNARTFRLIESSAESPLRFKVTSAGYRYVGGKGVVKLDDGRVVRLAP
jgi:hypothetical protein